MPGIEFPCLLNFKPMIMNNTEERIYALHNRINARGVQIDTDLLDGAISIVNQMRLRSQTTIRRITKSQNGEKPKALAAWLSQKIGCEIESVSNQALECIQRYATDRDILQVVQARMILNRTSLSKFQAIADKLDADGRLRNMYVYQGAHTGRWTSVDVQLHNLPRSGMTDKDLDKAIEIVSKGDYSLAYKTYEEELPDILAALVRACFTAPEGKILAVADYSAIESRVLAWLAGEEWKLKVFRTTGRIYEATAAKMFGIPEREITSEQRSCGKVADLALGYGGGIGAIEKKGGIHGWKIMQMEKMVRSWRDANRKIVSFWRTLERIIKDLQEGESCNLEKITLTWNDGTLVVSLPSGRSLIYPDMERYGNMSYMQDGVRKKIYGGLLTENIVQAIARDILAEAMLRVDDDYKYKIVMHTHDELIVEIFDMSCFEIHQVRDWDVIELCRRMEQAPEWAEGLPLKVEEFVTRHYKK